MGGRQPDVLGLARGYLQGDPDIVSVSSSIFFHAGGGCSGEILDVVTSPVVRGGEGWTHVVVSADVPTGTRSIDVLVSAQGEKKKTVTTAIDNVCVSAAS